jgi:hypothetical protein
MRTQMMDLSYWEKVAEGYQAIGKALPPDMQARLEAARSVAGKQAVIAQQEEAQHMAEFRQGFYEFDDLGWAPKGKANYRGAHTLRALALFTTRSVDEVHAELTVCFEAANANRKKSSQKHESEKRWLANRTEVPNWLVKAWCDAEGLVCTFGKGFGEQGLLLQPGVMPDDSLVLLTKDWLCIRGGKIVASWNPLWHDHRAVNGIWVRP